MGILSLINPVSLLPYTYPNKKMSEEEQKNENPAPVETQNEGGDEQPPAQENQDDAKVDNEAGENQPANTDNAPEGEGGEGEGDGEGAGEGEGDAKPEEGQDSMVNETGYYD